jgi:hypothetical protein
MEQLQTVSTLGLPDHDQNLRPINLLPLMGKLLRKLFYNLSKSTFEKELA